MTESNSMKIYYLLSLITLFMFSGCGNHTATTEHEGKRSICLHVANLDTLQIRNSDMGAAYNNILMDSTIIFADPVQCKLFFYNLSDGTLNDTRLGYGQGPNELISMLYAHPLQNAKDEIIIVDSSAGMYSYYPSTDSLSYRGRIDFNWGKGKRGDYNDSENYKLMEMSDFGISFFRQDSDIIVPLSLIKRKFGEINEEYFAKGHIFGRLSTDSLKVHELFGNFPEIYADKPTLYFEFFDFVIDNDRIIYNFAPDPLIYIADLNGNPIKTIGFEPKGINREYTIGFESTVETFNQDFDKVGINTGLYLDKESGLLFRTSMRDFNSGEIVLQAYDRDGNLVLEEEMPTYFKLLGKRDGKYYGARFIPEEVDDDLIYPVYSFTIK